MEIRGTQGCALATPLHSPTARVGSPTKAQPCVPLISTMHGQPFLIPLTQNTEVPWTCTCYQSVSILWLASQQPTSTEWGTSEFHWFLAKGPEHFMHNSKPAINIDLLAGMITPARAARPRAGRMTIVYREPELDSIFLARFGNTASGL